MTYRAFVSIGVAWLCVSSSALAQGPLVEDRGGHGSWHERRHNAYRRAWPRQSWSGAYGGYRYDRQPPIDLRELQVLTNLCRDAFEGSTNEQQCLDVLLASPRQAEAQWIVPACQDAFEGDPNELACLQTMSRSFLPLAAISACENAFEGDTNEQSCLNNLIGTRYDPAALVAYCDENFTGDTFELACLTRFR